jgi:hypothetical protein
MRAVMDGKQLNKKTCLSVRFTSGVLKLADGRALPRISDGTLGDLLIPAEAVQEDNAVREVSEDGILLLSKGSFLWARVNSDEISSDLKKFRVTKTTPNGKSQSCVQLELKQDLKLIPKNNESSLSPCLCFISALQEQAESVNEAYTKISVAFEPTRRSNTGNVFLVVFAEQGPNVVSLNTLRRNKKH